MTGEERKEQFGAINAQFGVINARFGVIKTDIAEEGIKTRRHLDVVAEGLRLEIRIIAEGHDALRQDVTELKAGQQRLETGQGRLEIRQLALESRQGRLEVRQETLETSQQELVTEVRLLAERLPDASR